MEAGKLIITTEMDTAMLDKEIDLLQDRLEGLESELDAIESQDPFEDQASEVRKLYNEIDTTRSKLQRLIKKKQELNEQPDGGFKNFIESLGEKLEGGFGKITKIGFALLGLRTGLFLIRNSVNMIAEQNDDVANKLSVFKLALANLLSRVVIPLVDFLTKILVYSNYILKAWFGIDLFANNTSKSTNKMKKGIGGANKEATKLKRTLAGFDEMNILQKDGSVGTGGGGGGISTPDIDTSFVKDIEIPEWVKWIADNKEGILNTLKEIAILIGEAFVIAKVVEFMGVISKLHSVLDGLSNLKIFGVLGGIAISLYGVTDLVLSIANGTANLNTVLKDLGIILDGVAVAMIAFNASNPLGWITLVIGAVLTLTGAFGDDEQAIKDVEQAQKDLNKAQQDYANATKQHLKAYDDKKKAEEELKRVAKELGITENDLREKGALLHEELANGKRQVSSLTPEERKLYEAYLNELDASEKLIGTQEKMKEARKEELNQDLELQRSNAFTAKSFEEYGKAVAKAYEEGAISGEEAGQRIYEVLGELDEKTRQTFVDGLPDKAKKGMLEFSKQLGWASKSLPQVDIVFNANTSNMTNAFNKAFNLIKNKASTFKLPTVGNAKGGIIGFAKGGVLPKLAPGGIINRPGPGVAIGGERGPEGVIPLTDSQQMNRLGMAIGKNVTIQAEIPVYVGGRQVSREMKIINADDVFAYNG